MFEWMSANHDLTILIASLVGGILIALGVIVSFFRPSPEQLRSGSVNKGALLRERIFSTIRDVFFEAGFAILIVLVLHLVSMRTVENRTDAILNLLEKSAIEGRKQSEELKDTVWRSQLVNLPQELQTYARKVLVESPFYYSSVTASLVLSEDPRYSSQQCLTASVVVHIEVHNRSSAPQIFEQLVAYHDITDKCAPVRYKQFQAQDSNEREIMDLDEIKIATSVRSANSSESKLAIPITIPGNDFVHIRTVAEMPLEASDNFFWHTRYPTLNAEILVHLPLSIVEPVLVKGFPSDPVGTKIREEKNENNPFRVTMTGGIMPGQTALFVWRRKDGSAQQIAAPSHPRGKRRR